MSKKTSAGFVVQKVKKNNFPVIGPTGLGIHVKHVSSIAIQDSKLQRSQQLLSDKIYLHYVHFLFCYKNQILKNIIFRVSLLQEFNRMTFCNLLS